MKSRRLMSIMTLPRRGLATTNDSCARPPPTQLACRIISLPQRGRLVLWAGLNRSESGFDRPAALRNFGHPMSALGHKQTSRHP